MTALLSRHAELLTRSAISPEVAHARGYVSLTAQTELNHLQVPGPRGPVGVRFARGVTTPGLLIPLYNVRGEHAGYQYRPDTPRLNKDGHPQKYETPLQQPNILDVPPTVRERLHKGRQAIFITEGARKADALASIDIAAINLSGVWNWRGKNPDQGSTTLADWEEISIKGSLFVLAFDSDVLTKWQVHHALERLKKWLERRGAKQVRVLVLPPGLDGKNGVDDYIYQLRSAQENEEQIRKHLATLIQDELPAPPPINTPASNGNKPSIIVNRRIAGGETEPREMHVLSADAWAAVQHWNEPPQLFVHAGLLKRLEFKPEGPKLEVVTKATMRGIADRAASWARWNLGDNGWVLQAVSPPYDSIIEDMLTTPNPPVPPIMGILEAPFLGRNYQIVSRYGYDAATQVFLDLPASLQNLQVSDSPTRGEIEHAHDFLETELFGDFPFVSPSDRANTHAKLFAGFVKEAIDDLEPGYGVTAPTKGSGKGKLIDATELPLTGRPALRDGLPRGKHSDEELEKKLIGILSQGRRHVMFDNIEGKVDSPILARYLTASHVGGRVLGTSNDSTFKQRITWSFTGNNIQWAGDIPRRVVPIRLMPGVERPDLREDFRHPELEEWIKEHRAEVVTAILTILQGWVAAGCPDGKAKMASFQKWARIISGILEFVGIDGFLGNRDETFDTDDVETAAWREFVNEWAEVYTTTPVKASDLLKMGQERECLPVKLYAETDQGRAVEWGGVLRSRNNRIFLGHRITEAKPEKGAKRWQLVPIAEDSPETHQDSTPVFPGSDAPQTSSGKTSQNETHPRLTPDLAGNDGVNGKSGDSRESQGEPWPHTRPRATRARHMREAPGVPETHQTHLEASEQATAHEKEGESLSESPGESLGREVFEI